MATSTSRSPRRGIRTLFQEKRGVAAIEFALLLPLLLLLLFGTLDLCRMLLIQEKADKVATTVADLVAQGKTVTEQEINDIMLAANQVMAPFAFGDNGVVIITSVSSDADGSQPTINWQRKGGGTLAADSKVGTGGKGSPATLPPYVHMAPRDNVIVGEVYYHYVPLYPTLSFLQARTLYEFTIYKPRLGILDQDPQ